MPLLRLISCLPLSHTGRVTDPIRVMLVDDHPVVRKGIAAMLEDEPGFAVVAQARSAEEALALFVKHAPDVTVMDLHLPGASGVDAIRSIKLRAPESRFVVLTTYDGICSRGVLRRMT